MKKSEMGNISYESSEESQVRDEFVRTFRECPIPDSEILGNLGLFLSSKNLSRILFMNHLYQQIIDIQGIVIEFGVRWGQNSSLFAALRGIYEPFNRHRKIVGFDTFKGFPALTAKDGRSKLMRVGADSVTKNYVQYLARVMELQEKDNPLGHIKKFELVAGDAVVEIDKYLTAHPETIVALAYFDFDLYEPTRKCLEAIRPHLVRGSLLGFDELNDPDSPGETVALKEVLGLNKIHLKRFRYASRVSYMVVE